MRPLSGVYLRADRFKLAGGAGRPFFVFSPDPVKSIFIHMFLRKKDIHWMGVMASIFEKAMYFWFMTIGENIRNLRKAKGLTQAELGTKIGTRQKVIADYENGISKPPRDRLLALARFFDMPVEKIIGKTDSSMMPKPPKEGKIHGNKRTAKLVQAFEQLSETEQRVILNQTQALAEKRKNGKKGTTD